MTKYGFLYRDQITEKTRARLQNVKTELLSCLHWRVSCVREIPSIHVPSIAKYIAVKAIKMSYKRNKKRNSYRLCRGIKSEFRACSRAVHQQISQKCQQKTKAN